MKKLYNGINEYFDLDGSAIESKIWFYGGSTLMIGMLIFGELVAHFG